MTNAARKFPWPTVGGYDLYEVLSALQKSIRRGMEEDALFWGTELYLSDYADHAWNRLLVISSEDVGLAAPQASISVKNLHDLYNRDKKSGESRLHFDHAVSALARAPKSRIVDHACIVAWNETDRQRRALPAGTKNAEEALQQSLAKGDEQSALYWASTLDLEDTRRNRKNEPIRGPKSKAVWEHIDTAAHEGLSEQIEALYENWKKKPEVKLWMAHAILLVCRARNGTLPEAAEIQTDTERVKFGIGAR
jgi:MgsA AAA+ ATPase C terminal